MTRKLKILICPDSFKGTLSSKEAALIIKKGIEKIVNKSKISIAIHPIADGGEGLIESIFESNGIKISQTKAKSPLGRIITTEFGILNNHTAIIEMAKISGLTLIPLDKRNPFLTSTYGTGELIKRALDLNLKKIIIGIGGSATNDGGIGMAQALGVKFLDDNKLEIKFNKKTGYSAKSLENLANIDLNSLDPRIKKTKILVCSDVTNKLLGKNGASFIYGKQKGAKELELPLLDSLLSRLNQVAVKDLGKNMNKIIGGGAAGGLGAGLVAFLDAEIVPGLLFISKLTKLDQKIKNADIIITGEGKMDGQTKFDKAPYAILKIGKSLKKPVYALNGYLEKSPSEFAGVYGTNKFATFDPKKISENSSKLLLDLSEKFAREVLEKLLK